MGIDAGDALVQALHEHNPWWEAGAAAFELPARQKSDFYHLARPEEAGSQFEDQPLLGLVGRRGVGKTTLLHQFVHHRIEGGDEPERFCYLPFDADPLYQLQSDEQLRRAVRYYESRILGRIVEDGPAGSDGADGLNGRHFLLLDDVHRIEHPTKPSIDGWGVPVADLLAADGASHAAVAESPVDATRHVVVTASAEVQVDRELDEVEVASSTYDTQPILPEKFRDYVFGVYPDLEASQETRVSPTSLRRGEGSLPRALETGDLEQFVAELRDKYAQVAHVERRLQSRVVDYLAMGGTISFAQDGVVESAGDLDARDYERLREDVRDALYQEVPGFESIQTIADLERLIALAARNRAAEPLRYQDLVDLFDVDRRTIADSYLPALEQLYLLSGVTEYDNSRPRSVRLYLRDTGLLTALVDGDASVVRNDVEREAELAHVAGFDHTMRLAYGIDAMQGVDRAPEVQWWRGRAGEVAYVFEVGGTPVPVGLAYRAREREAARASVAEFLEVYDGSLGLVLVGDSLQDGGPIEVVGSRVVEVPYWLYLLVA